MSNTSAPQTKLPQSTVLSRMHQRLLFSKNSTVQKKAAHILCDNLAWNPNEKQTDIILSDLQAILPADSPLHQRAETIANLRAHFLDTSGSILLSAKKAYQTQHDEALVIAVNELASYACYAPSKIGFLTLFAERLIQTDGYRDAGRRVLKEIHPSPRPS